MHTSLDSLAVAWFIYLTEYQYLTDDLMLKFDTNKLYTVVWVRIFLSSTANLFMIWFEFVFIQNST